jgi:hypothetical protein
MMRGIVVRITAFPPAGQEGGSTGARHRSGVSRVFHPYPGNRRKTGQGKEPLSSGQPEKKNRIGLIKPEAHRYGHETIFYSV